MLPRDTREPLVGIWPTDSHFHDVLCRSRFVCRVSEPCGYNSADLVVSSIRVTEAAGQRAGNYHYAVARAPSGLRARAAAALAGAHARRTPVKPPCLLPLHDAWQWVPGPSPHWHKGHFERMLGKTSFLKPGSMYSTIGSGTASQATPQFY